MRANCPLFRCILCSIVALALLTLTVACRGEDRTIFRDRFADSGSGWGSESTESFDRGYEDGEYFIEVYEPDWFVWAYPGRKFSDVAVEVEASPDPDSPDGHFGILCRYRRPDNFYYFAVTQDGSYAIMRFEDGEVDILTGDGFLPSPAVRPDGETYLLRAICVGKELILYVDGQEVATVTDNVFRQGDVGLGVGSGPEGDVRVQFDDLIAAAEEEEE